MALRRPTLEDIIHISVMAGVEKVEILPTITVKGSMYWTV
jgi:hypothetical protein